MVRSYLKRELTSFEFKARKKTDPPHKNSRKKYTLDDAENPKLCIGLARILIRNMDMYYNANTANNVKKYLLEYLKL